MTIIYQALGWLLGTIYGWVNSYGLALILFTVVIKTILFPLSVHQQKAMAKTAKLQPKVQEIQRKYKNNREKQSQELMKLYKEENANPTSGCLPLLIQLPIIYALYRVITTPLQYIVGLSLEQIQHVVTTLGMDVSKFGEGADAVLKFAKANQIDIANQLSLNIDKFPEFADLQMIDFNFFGMDLAKTPELALDPLILIPILAALAGFLSSWYSANYGPSAAMANEQTKSMNRSMLITMPAMSLWFTFMMPAGVGIYWIISSVMMIVQQFALNKIFPVEKTKPLTKEEEKARRKAERKEAIRRKAEEAEEMREKARLMQEEAKRLQEEAQKEAQEASEEEEEEESQQPAEPEKKDNSKNIFEE
ncbi:MAG: membrane protein insertase YidC [Eubacteriales bacterium]|jgi:YidC/Oxa1 family membrane protein insertase